MNKLDALQLPLKGTHLIEASAGTGKTYTLGLLVLRLIVEAPSPGLDMRRLAVVTFTEAAAGEIAERVRNLLVTARALESLDPHSQETLHCILLRANGGGGPLKAALRARLEGALMDLDLARITTIHGFCKGLLERFAFDTGVSFQREISLDLGDLRAEILADFWRQKIYTLPQEFFSLLGASLPTPSALAEELKELDNFPLIEVRGPQPLQESDLAGMETLREQLRQSSKEIHPLLFSYLRKAIGDKTLSGRVWQSRWVAGRESALVAFAQGDAEVPGEVLEKYLTLEALEVAQVAGFSLPESLSKHPYFSLFESWLSQEKVLKNLLPSLKLQAHQYLQKELKRRKNEQGLCSAGDLISDLGLALREKGEGLIARLRKEFEAVLVDEFQDTDPLQYEIFSTLFQNRAELFFAMIGDPKQAIYRFRGGDIEAYLRAQSLVNPSNCHTLTTNYRSDPQLIEALNQLFQKADAFTRGLAGLPHGEENGLFLEKGINYQMVEAGVTQNRIVDSRDQNPVPLTLWDCEGSLAPKNYQILHKIVTEIQRLVQNYSFLTPEGKRAVGLGDMAILVSSHGSAQYFKRALAEYGIPSVTGKGESLLGSNEAQLVQQLLQTALEPTREEFRRALLLSDLHHFNDEQLKLWAENPQAQTLLFDHLARFLELWKLRGIHKALMFYLRDCGYLKLSLGMGQDLLFYRRVTNLRHVLEILHTQEQKLGRVPERLLNHFMEMRRTDRELEQRLESDEEAVEILTMHKSKGLQWPIVFAPELGKTVINFSKTIIFQEYTQGVPSRVGSFHLEDEKAIMEAHKLALYKEKMRLAYVAMTRAESLLYVVVPPAKQDKEGSPAPAKATDYLFAHFSFESNLIQRLPLKVNSPPQAQMNSSHTPQHEKLPLVWDEGRKIQRDWWISSYSGMTRNIHTSQALPQGGLGDLEPLLANFPRGAVAGTALHNIFEKLDFVSASRPNALEEAGLIRQWQRILALSNLPQDLVPGVALLVKRVLGAPIRAVSNEFTLGQLSGEDRLEEMPFYLGMQLSTPLKAALLAQALAPLPAQVSAGSEVAGFLTGTIDLVFRAQGRWWILDWKSNFLGNSVDDYSSKGVSQAMDQNNYHLQYHLYTLALHRYLGASQENYSYESHFGGVLYVFLRGADQEGNGVFFHRPQEDVLQKLEDLL